MPVTLEEAQIYDPYETYISQTLDDSFKYEQLHKKLASSQDNFIDFIFSSEIAEFIKSRIAEPFNLTENQSKETAKIVMELLLTDWYLGDAVNQIVQRLDIDEQKARAVAGLMVSELFAPILEDLKKTHIEKFAQNDDRTINLKNQ